MGLNEAFSSAFVRKASNRPAFEGGIPTLLILGEEGLIRIAVEFGNLEVKLARTQAKMIYALLRNTKPSDRSDRTLALP